MTRVISIRKLAALDIAFLGKTIILTEFTVGVIGPVALGVWTLVGARSTLGTLFGVYLLSLGLNYVPLLLHAIDICRRGTAEHEIAGEIGDRAGTFRKYRRQSFFLLLPFIVPIVAVYQLRHSMTIGRISHAVKRHPAASFFAIVFVFSWGIGFALPIPALALFPVLILSVAAAALVLTRVVDGSQGLTRLWAEAKAWKIGRWYGLVLVPPTLILIVLLTLRTLVGPSFTPNFFPAGFLFGIPAGLFEEIGWTGYALPKIQRHMSWRGSSVLLGLLWGLWHLPVIDALGAASPHRTALLAFALAFIAAVSGLRVLIAWAALNTRSLPIAQLIHISSTGSLVVFGPPRVSAAQEALWYGIYAIALWIVASVLLIRRSQPRPLTSTSPQPPTPSATHDRRG